MRIRKLLSLVWMLLAFSVMKAQDNPVSWTTKVVKESEQMYQVIFKAKIESPWKMYDLGPYNDGPNPTTFTFKPGDGMQLEGRLKMLTTPTRHQDAMFNMEIGSFKGSAEFIQRVKLNKPGAILKVNVEWMVCDEGSCMPPDDVDLTIEVGNLKAAALPVKAKESIEEKQSKVEPVSTEAAVKTETEVVPATAIVESASQIKEMSVAAPLEAEVPTQSLWSFILEAIIWGFAALLTPCVFPMVPMVVSFFLKSNTTPAKARLNASLYGFFIVALYTLPIAAIILITRWLGGDSVTADIFNFLATHWIPNVLFFIIFMVFAASFFGAFEIMLPNKMVNQADSNAHKGGIAGIFFMALTLVLVSFSCTGPIVGSVLIKSTSGEFVAPIVTMFAFSVAFALPFTLLAFFPSLLKNMPKSGGWLNSVKVVLGFVEVALGLKFLSVADQTYHWGILDREIYLAIWIVVFTLLGLYLLGKLRFAHDSELKTVSVPRLALAIASFSFVVYMIPGMWGAPLKGLSGYLPPISTQDFNLTQSQGATSNAPKADFVAKYSDFLHLPHGLQGFFDYDEAVAYAKQVNKPIFVDITGHGCVNCREMEARVWSDPRVLELLRNEFVIVALYADDKKELPESEWITTDKGKVLKTLGKINSYTALTKFGVNAQPYYTIVDAEGTHLVTPRGYDLNVPAFIKFLETGVENFKKR